jgi:hypothetical protein
MLIHPYYSRTTVGFLIIADLFMNWMIRGRRAGKDMIKKIFVYLTPFVPLSLRGVKREGEELIERLRLSWTLCGELDGDI